MSLSISLSISLNFDRGNNDSIGIDGDGIDSSDSNGDGIEGGDRCLKWCILSQSKGLYSGTDRDSLLKVNNCCKAQSTFPWPIHLYSQLICRSTKLI